MKKSTMRAAALSFLATAILTGSFAIFYQGNIPVQGMTLDSIINKPKEKESNESALQENLDRLNSENSKLIEENAKLNESLVALKDDQNAKESKKNEESKTSEQSENTSSASETQESLTDETTVETTTQEPVETQTFVINDGDGSEEIAQRLVDQGLIDNTSEFLDIVYQWNLQYVLQTGSFELNSNMSAHDIASILTDGQYYYIP